MSPLGSDERRQSKRFMVREGSSFVVTHKEKTLGKIIDISEGGFAFSYESERVWSAEQVENCMIFGDHDSCLSNLPMDTVQDQIFKTPSSDKEILVRRRSVKFGVLNRSQKDDLDFFIWINGVSDC